MIPRTSSRVLWVILSSGLMTTTEAQTEDYVSPPLPLKKLSKENKCDGRSNEQKEEEEGTPFLMWYSVSLQHILRQWCPHSPDPHIVLYYILAADDDEDVCCFLPGLASLCRVKNMRKILVSIL